MLPRHLRISVEGVSIESIDSVRYQAALEFARLQRTEERRWPELEKLQTPDAEVNGEALIAELDTLARLTAPPGIPGVLGNLRDDTLRGLARARGRS